MFRFVYIALATIFILFAIVDFVAHGDRSTEYSAFAMACLAMERTYMLESDERGER